MDSETSLDNAPVLVPSKPLQEGASSKLQVQYIKHAEVGHSTVSCNILFCFIAWWRCKCNI